MSDAEKVELALAIAARIAKFAMDAMEQGDTSAVDSLHGVVPMPELIKARGEALKAEERAKDRAAFGSTP